MNRRDVLKLFGLGVVGAPLLSAALVTQKTEAGVTSIGPTEDLTMYVLGGPKATDRDVLTTLTVPATAIGDDEGTSWYAPKGSEVVFWPKDGVWITSIEYSTPKAFRTFRTKNIPAPNWSGTHTAPIWLRKGNSLTVVLKHAMVRIS